MNLSEKLVSELVINGPAERFYKVFREKCFLVPKICPNAIQEVDIHDAEWDNHDHGSIKTWYYTVDGKAEVFKEKVEFYDQKLTMILVGMEGDVFNYYKSYKSTFQVVPKDDNHCQAVMTIEYEKIDDASPYPYKYINLMNTVTKDIESHLIK